MKKLTFVIASFSLAMFAACGDDSSSGAATSSKDAQGRTIYNDMQEALEAPCSEANKCEVIILNDPIAKDTLQCNGSSFMSMITGPVSGCAAEPASSSSDAGEDPASSSAAEPVAESSSAGAPAADDEKGSTGDLVSCDVTVEGVLGEHSCVEGSAGAAPVSLFCSSLASLGPDMHMSATAGTSCAASASALKCVKNGMNFYSLDGSFASCDEFFEASMLSGLAE